MDGDSKCVLRKLIIDFVLLLCVSFPILFFHLWGVPFERGFFCDDESLRHPYHDSTVTSTMLYLMGLLLPITLMTVTEILHARHSSERPRYFMSRPIPTWVWHCYSVIGVFGFGAACSQLTTDLTKYSVGRLRPHFFQICDPNIDCLLPSNQNRYIEDYQCNGSDKSLIREGRLSFPSGHCSFSAYTMVYCALYIQARFTWNGARLPRHFLQFCLLMLALYTWLSRISDYKHHWSDALAGALLGSFVAIITATFISDLFTSVSPKEKEVIVSPYESDAEMATRPIRPLTDGTHSDITVTPKNHR